MLETLHVPDRCGQCASGNGRLYFEVDDLSGKLNHCLESCQIKVTKSVHSRSILMFERSARWRHMEIWTTFITKLEHT